MGNGDDSCPTVQMSFFFFFFLAGQHMNYLLVLGNLLLDEPLWEGRSIPHWETEKAVYCDWPLAARERDVPAWVFVP